MKQEKRPSDRPLLSFAIPTYNRAKYLDQLLGVLVKQLHDESRVEVIVSDNASTDNTPTVVEMYRQQGLSIRYLRNETNRGSDFNILQCYEQAAGKYVWIFGDDDLILNGGMSRVLQILSSGEPDLVFLAPYGFKELPSEIQPKRRMIPTQRVTDPAAMARLVCLYCDFMFISSFVVNKDRVSSAQSRPFSTLVGTSLVQLGWIFTALSSLQNGAFMELGVVAGRAGNSSGGFQIARVFGENYKDIAATWVCGHPKLAKQLIDDHLQKWFPRNWIQFRGDLSKSRETHALLRKTFGSSLRYWLCAYPIERAPRAVALLWCMGLRLLIRIQIERLSVAKYESRSF